MTLMLRERESIDDRVLGALRCVHGTTGVPLELPIDVRAVGATLRRNLSGLYVIARVAAPAELVAHEASFATPPGTPAVGSTPFVVSLRDPSGLFLPRSAAVALPRNPLPGVPNSLFTPIDIPMYPAARAPLGANWAVLRVRVREAATGDALGGALLIVRDGADRELARGQSDWRGEASLPVPGVPVTTWSTQPGAVVVSEIPAEVELIYERRQGSRVRAADAESGRMPQRLALPDLEDLARRARALHSSAITQPVLLAAGRAEPLLTFTLALPPDG
jgi:hypothetical protein